MRKIIITLLVVTTVIIVVPLVLQDYQEAEGRTPGNLPALLATSSTVEIGLGVSVLFPATPGRGLCSSRVIGTVDPIVIQFDATATSSLDNPNNIGYAQAASTTVSYSSDDYGCGNWLVKNGVNSSSTISIAEFRQ